MIDPTLALQTQAPGVPGMMGQLVSLKNAGMQQQAMQQQSQLRDQQIQGGQIALNQAGQSAQDSADTRAAVAAATDPQTGKMDRGVLLSTLGKLNPYAAAQTATSLASQDIATQQAQAKLQSAQAAAQKAQVAAATAHVSAVDQLLQGVTDQATYTSAIQHAQSLGMVQPGELPAVYDPQLVARLHANALTQAAVLKNAQAAQDEKDRAAQAAATLQNTQNYQKSELGIRKQEVGIQGARLKMEQEQSGMGSNGAPNDLAQAIAKGQMPIDRMGYLLSKNPGLLQQVMKIDPSFDGSKAASYATTYKDYTNTAPTKAGGAILAGGTAFEHLKQLGDLNTDASHIPGTNAYTAYNNQAVTVAGELAKFYGENTDEGRASILKTLQTTLPGNRQAAIRTQAQAMGQRLDNYQQAWDNAAPSKSYEAPMPGISPQAKAARAALDPNYSAQSAPSMVTVQIPGSPPGQIPAAAVQKFKADHPNAVVTQ